MIEIRGLTKQYGHVRAVDDVTFDVQPGLVTGFLGPNGAGKSTTMRITAGVDRPTAGSVTVQGRRYADLRAPLRHVGALLDAEAMHPSRSGRAHLRIAAAANGIPSRRVDEVLDRVGLTAAAGRRVRGYSLGMRQRLGIASALLGDPPVLLFDEPVNGLDLDGVRWVRKLVRQAAEEGRTVLVSSHLMSEVEQVADRLVVIGRGRVVADVTLTEMLHSIEPRTRVRSPRADELARHLAGRRDVTVRELGSGELEVRGATAADVGDTAHVLGLPLHHLRELQQSLEEAFLALTEDSVEHGADHAEARP